ncbi:MAG: SDR family oxidoreductase [Ideonella sp.]|nr:SDR family oxidoreductase [Ideonella sp.]
MKAADARVLLTGANGGIGQAMARALRQAGAQVMGVGRGVAGPAGLAWHRADLNEACATASVAQAAADWRANVVVHASGMPGFGALQSISPLQMEQVLQANLLAPMRLTQALLPQLLRLPRAQVVFVGSALGRIGLPGFSVYGASKAGLHGFAEALRRELADTSVRVQILGPRSTRTGFNGVAVEAYNQATGTAMDSPEIVAAALLALIESEAAETFVGFPERLGVRLNGLLGARMDGSFVKHRRSLQATTIQPATPGTTT